MRWLNRVSLILLLITLASLFNVACAEPKYTALNTHTYYDESITPRMVFDGANYLYVTPWGNYTFTATGNILKFTDYQGIEVIDKSVFVFQHNKTGDWLPLIDFYDNQLGNPVVSVASDTYYEWLFNVYDKKIIIGEGKLNFTVNPNPSIPPKIHTEIRLTEFWEHGSYRWIWDIVPSGNYHYYINETTGELEDVNSINGLKELFNNTKKEKLLLNDGLTAIRGILDISDYNASLWYGGSEPNWNTKGFVTIFPVNESIIDPIAYTETIETIDETDWNDNVWNTDQDCGAAPANSVAEIIAFNDEDLISNLMGVRETISELNRTIYMHEGEDGGGVTARFLVNVDSNGNVDFFSADVSETSFYLVGYWTDSNFTEEWDAYQPDNVADDFAWVATNETVGTGWSDLTADSAHLISLVNFRKTASRFMGVRAVGSELSRSVDIHEAEDGGDGGSPISMFVQTDSAGNIEFYTEVYNHGWFYNQGFFTDINFTEAMNLLTTTKLVWTDQDLSVNGTPNDAIVDILNLHGVGNEEHNLGSRIDGSGVNRYILEHEAEPAGGQVTGFGMTTQTDSSAVLETYYSQNLNYFGYYTGYFSFVVGGAEEYIRSVTQSISASSSVDRLHKAFRSATQGISTSSEATRILGAKRDLSQSITSASTVSRIYGAVRTQSQGLTVASSSGRGYKGIRGVSQGVTVSNTVSRVLGAIRGLSQGFTTSSSAGRVYGVIRNLSQSITTSSAVSRIYQAVRSTTQGISINNTVTRVFYAIRGLSQNLSLSSSVDRVFGIVRGLSQSITTSNSISRIYQAVRSTTQSITVSNVATRLTELIRSSSQGISINGSVSRICGIIRGVTQSITTGSAASRLYGGIRDLTQSITTNSVASRILGIKRILTQGLTLASEVSRILSEPFNEFIRGVTQSITTGSSISRAYGAVRGLTQSITTSSTVSRLTALHRGLTQIMDIITYEGLPPTFEAVSGGFIQLLPIIVLIFVAVLYFNLR